MNIFSHHVHFKAIDPLGDGLGDEIAAEQAEPEAIVLEDDSIFVDTWQAVLDGTADNLEGDDQLNRSIDE